MACNMYGPKRQFWQLEFVKYHRFCR